MLVRAKLFPETTYRVLFADEISRPYISFLSADGIQTLCHLELRFEEAVLVINDRIDGRWGKEARLPTRRGQGETVNEATIRFADGALQVSNDLGTTTLERFDHGVLERVHFLRHFGTRDPEGMLAMLVASPEHVRTQIENRILSHRLDRLERLAGVTPDGTVS